MENPPTLKVSAEVGSLMSAPMWVNKIMKRVTPKQRVVHATLWQRMVDPTLPILEEPVSALGKEVLARALQQIEDRPELVIQLPVAQQPSAEEIEPTVVAVPPPSGGEDGPIVIDAGGQAYSPPVVEALMGASQQASVKTSIRQMLGLDKVFATSAAPVSPDVGETNRDFAEAGEGELAPPSTAGVDSAPASEPFHIVPSAPRFDIREPAPYVAEPSDIVPTESLRNAREPATDDVQIATTTARSFTEPVTRESLTATESSTITRSALERDSSTTLSRSTTLQPIYMMPVPLQTTTTTETRVFNATRQTSTATSEQTSTITSTEPTRITSDQLRLPRTTLEPLPTIDSTTAIRTLEPTTTTIEEPVRSLEPTSITTLEPATTSGPTTTAVKPVTTTDATAATRIAPTTVEEEPTTTVREIAAAEEPEPAPFTVPVMQESDCRLSQFACVDRTAFAAGVLSIRGMAPLIYADQPVAAVLAAELPKPGTRMSDRLAIITNGERLIVLQLDSAQPFDVARKRLPISQTTVDQLRRLFEAGTPLSSDADMTELRPVVVPSVQEALQRVAAAEEPLNGDVVLRTADFGIYAEGAVSPYDGRDEVHLNLEVTDAADWLSTVVLAAANQVMPLDVDTLTLRSRERLLAPEGTRLEGVELLARGRASGLLAWYTLDDVTGWGLIWVPPVAVEPTSTTTYRRSYSMEPQPSETDSQEYQLRQIESDPETTLEPRR